MAYDEKLADRLRKVLEGEPGLSEKKMFGGLAFLVNGNMAVSASGQGGLLLRVDPEETRKLLAREPRKAAPVRGGRYSSQLPLVRTVSGAPSSGSSVGSSTAGASRCGRWTAVAS